jgi:hypothetical protein
MGTEIPAFITHSILTEIIVFDYISAGADMQIKTITFGQAEIRSADDLRKICHLSADDLPLIRRGSAAEVQMAHPSDLLHNCNCRRPTGHPRRSPPQILRGFHE